MTDDIDLSDPDDVAFLEELSEEAERELEDDGDRP